MRTVGAGVKTEKSGNVAELEAENRELWAANESARARISDLETMLYESREQAAELQMQLEKSQKQAAVLQAQISEMRGQASEDQKPKSGKDKNTGK